jgi:acetyl esterase/lipase
VTSADAMTTRDWRLPPLREKGAPAPDDLAARRAGAAGMPPAPTAPGVTVRQETIAGVPCVVCESPSPVASIVYFHGGGYRLGSAAMSTAFGTRLANATSTTVVVVDYRLAPEIPFPAAVHDATAVYGAVRDGGAQVVLAAGDSAGGGLAAALAVACDKAGIAGPDGLILLSPWLDMTCSSETFDTRAATDQLFSKQSATEASQMYLQGHDQRDPLASPAFADVARFPPVLVFAGGDEVLLDDALQFASRLAKAGVSVELHAVRGMQHVWPTLFPDLPESARALDAMGRFVPSVVA